MIVYLRISNDTIQLSNRIAPRLIKAKLLLYLDWQNYLGEMFVAVANKFYIWFELNSKIL